MKKSTLVLILVIYIASIVIIGFFGVQIETFNVTYYVTSIQLLNETVPDVNNIDQYIMFEFIPNSELVPNPDYTEGSGLDEYLPFGRYSSTDPSNPNYVQLLWKVIPEDATYRNVTFEHTENSRATVNDFGTVIFTGPTTLTIYITSTDGTNVRNKIKVMAYQG